MNATIASAKAGSHPLRLRILDEMKGKSLSPNKLSVTLDESLGNVSYHVKTLLEYGCIQLDKTEPRRGAVEHYYSITPAGKRLLRSADGTDDADALDRIAAVLRTGMPGLADITGIVAGTGRNVD